MKSKGKRKNATAATSDGQKIVETKRGVPGKVIAGDPRSISS